MITIVNNVLVIHGPNLNLLGQREPDVYGSLTLSDLNAMLSGKAVELRIGIEFLQTNHEGVMVDAIQAAEGRFGCIIINPAAFTHYSVAVRMRSQRSRFRLSKFICPISIVGKSFATIRSLLLLQSDKLPGSAQRAIYWHYKLLAEFWEVGSVN